MDIYQLASCSFILCTHGEVEHSFGFLNQACASHRPARAWFLKIDLVRIVCMRVCVCVCMRVCPPLRLLITSGVMWHDMDLIRLVKQVLQLLYGNCSHYR